jgi:hypothetical protein
MAGSSWEYQIEFTNLGDFKDHEGHKSPREK